MSGRLRAGATGGQKARSTPSAAPLGNAALQGRTVLVVGDDRALRELIRVLLEYFGCSVRESTDGQDAIEQVRSGSTRVDVVIADVVLPRLGGRDLAERLATLCPSIPVVLISGTMSREQALLGLEVEPAAYLMKPFKPMELVWELDRVLREWRPAATARY